MLFPGLLVLEVYIMDTHSASIVGATRRPWLCFVPVTGMERSAPAASLLPCRSGRRSFGSSGHVRSRSCVVTSSGVDPAGSPGPLVLAHSGEEFGQVAVLLLFQQQQQRAG